MEVIKPKRFFVKGIKFKRKHYRKKDFTAENKERNNHKKRKKKHCRNPVRLLKTEDYVHHIDYNQTHTRNHKYKKNKYKIQLSLL